MNNDYDRHMVSIAGLDKAAVLAALYNHAMPQGLGWLKYQEGDMTRSRAGELLTRTTQFDYLFGRVLKVCLDGDDLDTWGYNRDNGAGAAERIIAALREHAAMEQTSVSAEWHP